MQQSKYFTLNICFIICLGFLQSQAYSISGQVLDSETKKPINNVDVYIEEDSIGSFTDESGYFILYLDNKLRSNVILNIKMIGYKKETFNIDLLNSTILLDKIYLKNQSIELHSTHIHSHHTKKDQISNIILSGQELNDNLTSNIATTLSNQPNIGVNSFGHITSKPVLRGYSGDRFLLTKNGYKIADLSQTSIDHAIALDMTEVGEIEILRGPKSLIYGSNTIGGVINTNLNTNPNLRADEFIKSILIGGESFNQGMYGSLRLYIPLKNNQMNIFISNKDTKNQLSPIEELENSYSKASNYKLGFTRYNKNNYINFVIENFNMDYGIPPSLEGHIDGVDIKMIQNAFQINYHQDLFFYNFNQLDIKYNFTDYQHYEFESIKDYFTVFLGKDTHNIKLEFKSFSAIIGAELNYIKFSPAGFYWTPKTNELDFSIYSFYEKEFDHFDLLSSFRMGHLLIQPQQNIISFSNLDEEEVIDRNFTHFSSSLGIRKFFNKFEFNTWIMNTMKAPRVEELYSDGPHLGTYSYEIGEPNLNLEKIYGIESSIQYDVNPFNVSLSTFYNYSPYYYQMNKLGECDLSGWDGNPPHPCAEELNENEYGEEFIEWGVGNGWLYIYKTKGIESIIKGMEFNLGYNHKNFKIKYDFSMVRGDDLTSERPLSYINPDKQILNLEYQKKSMNYKVRFSKIHSQNRLGEFETFTPSSILTDIILSYRYKEHNITIQCNNLFDDIYYNHLSKIKLIMPEPGRNISIHYRVHF